MNIGFDTTAVLMLHRPGQACLLPAGFTFWYRSHLFRHKPGGYSDGMSSPQYTHVFESADPYGWALPAAVAHDGVYHNAIEQCIGQGGWIPIDFGKDNGDQLFHDLLVVLANGNEARLMEARAFYEAVHLGGQTAFDEGRRQAAQLSTKNNQPT